MDGDEMELLPSHLDSDQLSRCGKGPGLGEEGIFTRNIPFLLPSSQLVSTAPQKGEEASHWLTHLPFFCEIHLSWSLFGFHFHFHFMLLWKSLEIPWNNYFALLGSGLSCSGIIFSFKFCWFRLYQKTWSYFVINTKKEHLHISISHTQELSKYSDLEWSVWYTCQPNNLRIKTNRIGCL
jgi:hypothetical protein